MLAKVWKKVLLAVCIIACIFNIMTKLVNRNSLEINLKSVNDGNTILDALKSEESNKNSDIIDGVKQENNNTVQNTMQEAKSTNEIEESKNNNEQNTEQELDTTSKKSDSGFKYTDYVIEF